MESVCASELRSNLTEILRRIESGRIINITLRGREVARLVPPDNKVEKARKKLDELRKTAFVGDVLSPIEEEWECMK